MILVDGCPLTLTSSSSSPPQVLILPSVWPCPLCFDAVSPPFFCAFSSFLVVFCTYQALQLSWLLRHLCLAADLSGGLRCIVLIYLQNLQLFLYTKLVVMLLSGLLLIVILQLLIPYPCQKVAWHKLKALISLKILCLFPREVMLIPIVAKCQSFLLWRMHLLHTCPDTTNCFGSLEKRSGSTCICFCLFYFYSLTWKRTLVIKCAYLTLYVHYWAVLHVCSL